MPAEEMRIKNLAVLRGQYVARNKGKPPANREVFEKFVKSLSAEELKRFGVEGNVDDLFVSPRDGEPYVLRSVPEMGAAKTVVLHEKTGKKGKRWVAFSTSEVQEVDQARFEELVGKTP